jgi:hypothetical protein
MREQGHLGDLARGAAIVCAITAVAIATNLLLARAAPPGERNEIAGVFLGVVGGTFGLLASFMLVSVWERRQDAEGVVAEEASALGNLFRLFMALPAPLGPQLGEHASGYADDLIHHEWALMAQRQVSSRVTHRVHELWVGLTGFAPTCAKEETLQRLALAELCRLSTQRRLRLMAMHRRLPVNLWLVLVGGALLTVLFAMVFGLRDTTLRMAMVGALAGETALIIVAIFALRNPFHGSGRLTSDELEWMFASFRHTIYAAYGRQPQHV